MVQRAVLETVYLVRGTIGSGWAELWPSMDPATTEWQVSDGPPGERGSSSDYLCLRTALHSHVGDVIDVTYADFTPAEQAVFFEFVTNRNMGGEHGTQG